MVPSIPPHGRSLGIAGIAALVTASILVGAHSIEPSTLTSKGEISGASNTVILTPGDWIGQRFPLLRHLEMHARIDSGRWFIILERYGCSKCDAVRTAINEQTSEVARSNRPVQVGYLAVADETSERNRHDYAASQVAFGRLDSSRHWVVRTPTVLLLVDGFVEAVAVDADTDTALTLLQRECLGNDASERRFPRPDQSRLLPDESSRSQCRLRQAGISAVAKS